MLILLHLNVQPYAGPVSFATTYELSLINVASSGIVNALPFFKIEIASISFVKGISKGPGATKILYSSLNLFFTFYKFIIMRPFFYS